MLSLFRSSILLLLIFLSVYVLCKKYTQLLNKKDISDKNIFKKNYIAFIFILFGLLKLYDLEKFVKIFSKYDWIAAKNIQYAYLYPFIEIAIGIGLLKNIFIDKLIFSVILLMIISILSVIKSILSGQKLRCGCLGSFFHIPLSYVTLTENTMMILMSISYLNNN